MSGNKRRIASAVMGCAAVVVVVVVDMICVGAGKQRARNELSGLDNKLGGVDSQVQSNSKKKGYRHRWRWYVKRQGCEEKLVVVKWRFNENACPSMVSPYTTNKLLALPKLINHNYYNRPGYLEFVPSCLRNIAVLLI